jgi:cytoskeletal protein CcmA (bactofilin family)
MSLLLPSNPGRHAPAVSRCLTSLSVLFTIVLCAQSVSSIKSNLKSKVVPAIALTANNARILGNAAPYAILAGSEVTNALQSECHGNLGISPSNAYATVNIYNGVIHAGDNHSLQAQQSLQTAYTNLNSEPSVDMSGTDLGTLGEALAPGVYKFATSAAITGTLTLDGQNRADATWIFQVGTTFITEVDAKVLIIKGGLASNVYWVVGTASTIKTRGQILGNILAQAEISLQVGAVLKGRALVRTGKVNLLNSIVDASQP